MSHVGTGYDINQTFIIEPTDSSVPVYSACTGFYTNNILSCSGNTQILLGNNNISFIGGLQINDGLTTNTISATTISATTFYGNGSNLTGILIQDTFVTGGTYSNGTAVFINNTGGTFSVTGFSSNTSSSFTGGTVSGNTIFTSGLSANTFSATTYLGLPLDIRVTGGTYSNGSAIFTNNTGGTFSVTGFKTSDVFVTGGTYTNGNAIFTNNTGGTFNVSGFSIGGGGGELFYLNISESKNGNRYLSTTASTAAEQSTGVTINTGATETIASFQSDVLGITLIPGGVWSFYLHSYKEDNNASFNIFVEVYKLSSGGTSTLLFATDPTAVTSNSPNPSMQLTDVYFSGSPVVVTDSVVAVVRATNTNNQPKIITLVSEGLQHYSYAVSTLPTQQGLTCDSLSGCSIIQTIQSNLNNKLDKSGGTITNNLVINDSLSATTYLGLPLDVFVTGGTYSNGTAIFINKTGGTFSVTGFSTPFTGGTVSGNTVFTNGLTANTLSASTYQNLPLDIRVTGGSYSNNTFTFTNNTGGTFNTSFNTVTGLTATTISATTLTLANQNANTVFAGPTSGSSATPTFRALVANDMPSGIPQYLFFKNTVQQIVNTTTPTEVITGLNIGTAYTFSANSLLTTDLYEIEVIGDFSCAGTGSSPAFDFTLGGVALNNGEINSLSTSTTRKPFIIKAHFYMQTTGSSSNCQFTVFEANGNANTSAAQSRGSQRAMPQTINTTISNLLSLKMYWSTAVSASNIITITSMTLKKIKF